MRPRDLLPIALLGGIAAFIIVQATGMRGSPVPAQVPKAQDTPAAGRPSRPRLAAPGDSAEPDSAAVVAAEQTVDSLPANETVETMASSAPAPPRDLDMVRALIRDGAPGTYLLEMLQEQDQLLMRWPERRIDALRVWIERNPALPDWDTSYPVVAEQVFEEWQRAGFPLRFDVVRDSANTEIQIRWIAAFPAEDREKLGMTRKRRDQHGWIHAADITIVTHDQEGRPLPAAVVAGTARHEIGHALGLGHSADAGDVMFPESRSPSISAADRATLHLLYILPPGSLK